MSADKKSSEVCMSRIRNKTKRGFTLVELLIVIIIIAVLAAVAIPKFANSSQRSKDSALRAELKLLRNAVELFKNDTGVYPAALADLALEQGSAPATGMDSAGASKPIVASEFKGPYVSSVDNDPITGAAFGYNTTSAPYGKVYSKASGNASDGTAYSTW
jgi:type II secretion system protein G